MTIASTAVSPALERINSAAALDLANCSDAAFASAVHRALATVGGAKHERFGVRKVFLFAAWRSLCPDGGFALHAFKERCLRANRYGHLALVRADLVAAMPPDAVADSEINDRGISFHFIIDPPAREPWETPAKAPISPAKTDADRTAELLDALPSMTERDFALLAIACADQAGLALKSQERLAAELAGVLGAEVV
ncbi:MAG TPA: hypothetical protein VFT22_07100 [Kofleriaceae bacterium]|nr:hypothetical protein [Kofleriaceae bacterium]